MFVTCCPNNLALNLFELSLRINGFPIKEATKQLSKIKAIPEEKYLLYIKKQRQEIFNYHLINNTFYKNFIGNTIPDSWEDIPIIQKNDLQIPLQERLSKGFTKQNCYVNKTSGSSGTPLIFAKDKYAHALTWAEIIDRFNWFGIDFNRSYQARFYGIPLNTKGYYTARLKDWFANRYRFPVFDLSEKKLDNFLTVFRKKKFNFINGYTSSLVLFAKHLQKKNTVLKDICKTLTCCVVTSEMLFESDKLLLEKWLGVPVINEYGAAELDLIGFTNTDGKMIVNSETLFVEILDPNNRPVAYGEPGKIVITSLYNKAHPFIRYQLGDIGILSKKSTPKKPVLKKLVGRTNDIARLPSGKTVPGLTFYYVTKSVIEDSGNVKEFVIEQLQISLFKIIYVSEIPLTNIQEETIKKAISLYLENDLQVVFQKVNMLNRNNNGKLKQFISHLSENDF